MDVSPNFLTVFGRWCSVGVESVPKADVDQASSAFPASTHWPVQITAPAGGAELCPAFSVFVLGALIRNTRTARSHVLAPLTCRTSRLWPLRTGKAEHGGMGKTG